MATLYPLPEPEPQFCDANGVPYAGGTITTYVPGTSTFQNTYSNMEGTALNTNPIILDAAGRALIYGTGNFRFVLKDANGNLIYDQETSAVDTSAFATPASVTAAVQTETNRAEAAEAAETSRAEAAETTLTNDLNAEIARAEAAEANLQSQITPITTGPSVQGGFDYTDSTGHLAVTFTTAYATGTRLSVVATTDGTGLDIVTAIVGNVTVSGFDVWLAFPETSGPTSAGIRGFYWQVTTFT